MNTKTVILTALLCVSTFLGAFAQNVESAAVVLEGVGMDVSIRNEGAFRITESISSSKEESENICSYKEWAVSTPTFHEDKKGKNILRQLF